MSTADAMHYIRLIVEDYNAQTQEEQTPRYSFLKVLSARDRVLFLRSLADDPALVRDCYLRKSIRTRVWIDILNRLPLELDYYIYRRAYWGEGSGNTRPSPHKTDRCVLYSAMGNRTEGAVHSKSRERRLGTGLTVASAEDDGHSLLCHQKQQPMEKHIVVEDNHVRTLSERTWPPAWVNERYALDHTEDIIH